MIIDNRDMKSALNVCICGNHKEGYTTIKRLEGLNVVIFYKDPKDDIIKPWNPEQAIEAYIAERTEKAKKEMASDILMHPFWDNLDLRYKDARDFRNDIWESAALKSNERGSSE